MTPDASLVRLFEQIARNDHQRARRCLATRDLRGAALALLDAEVAIANAEGALLAALENRA